MLTGCNTACHVTMPLSVCGCLSPHFYHTAQGILLHRKALSEAQACPWRPLSTSHTLLPMLNKLKWTGMLLLKGVFYLTLCFLNPTFIAKGVSKKQKHKPTHSPHSSTEISYVTLLICTVLCFHTSVAKIN